MTPFIEGYAARQAGLGLDANPHEYPARRSQWFRGWTAADRLAFERLMMAAS